MPPHASRCARCGGRSIRRRTGVRRFRPFRMMPAVPLPADLAIPTCARCYTEHIDEKTAETLAAALLVAYESELRRRAREAVAAVCQYTSQRQLERLVGLSQGYLCRLHAGQGTPSAALVALLALLAREPWARLRELELIWASEPPA